MSHVLQLLCAALAAAVLRYDRLKLGLIQGQKMSAKSLKSNLYLMANQMQKEVRVQIM